MASTFTTRDSVQPLLPACQRCRRLRRKCDTLLPQCRSCDKADEVCTYMDPMLARVVERKHVQSLLDRLEHLRSKESVKIMPPETTTSETTLNPVSRPKFDVMIGSGSLKETSRYWGSSSTFTLAVEVVQYAITGGLVHADLNDTQHSSQPVKRQEDKETFSRIMTCAPEADVQKLVDLFLSTSNKLYGFIDERLISHDVQTYLALRSRPDLTIRTLRGGDAVCFFRVSMMCAISAANEARHVPYRAAESLVYYTEALDCADEVTCETSPSSLQAVLLLVIFYLFYPRKGDIWKLLDYACRLMIELGYHIEPDTEHEASPSEARLRRTTFWGLYALERTVGHIFGRDSAIPEAIITTEYPSAHDDFETKAIAHHYRLVYLRSEIYTCMHLPASHPGHNPSLPSLRDKLMAISNWRSELPVSEPLSGIGALTCNQSFSQTTCFLFQPLLLHALRHSQQRSTTTADERSVVPVDSYLAACDIIRTYEQMIRAPKASVLGAYPMTFISAHHIWLATSTLTAHASLALSGRVRTLRRLCDWQDGGTDAADEPFDYGTFVDIAPTCSVLLHWCVERWPEMIGLVDVYDALMKRLTRELIRQGGDLDDAVPSVTL